MSKHTPGPWKAVRAEMCAEIEMMEIAEVAHMRVVPAAGGWPTPGQLEDDAQLIAAAPDLLKALQSYIACFERHEITNTHGARDFDFTGYIATLARAAIAKATGQ